MGTQIRSIYRVVEFGLGIDGYPFRNEWCLYVLEAVPMFIAIAVLGWYSPVKWMQPKSPAETETESAHAMMGAVSKHGRQPKTGATM